MTTRRFSDRVSSMVAVLIMIVSLLAAGFAYLDSQARNRAASAARRGEAAGVDVLRETGIREHEISQELIVYGYGNDLGWISVSLGVTGEAGSVYAAALGEAYTAARTQAETFSGILGSEYQSEDGTIQWSRFVEESRRPAYRAVELQKAHADVAAGWGAKSSKYVAIITILAAALFLLGLTVSVIRDSQIALVGTGVGLALAATLWGVTVWSSPVYPVSERAIDAYVDGAIAETTYLVPADLQFAERRLDDAIEANPRYREAYLARGYARFQQDLLDDEGPRGSLEAVADFEAALAIDDQDPISWSNLGASWFWLGDYEAAEVATRRAIAIDPDHPIMTLNLALLLAVRGDSGYEEQMDRVEETLVILPFWQREAVVASALDTLGIAELYRPDISAVADEMAQRLSHINREIAVGRRFFGSPTPTPVSATFSPPDFTLDPSGTALRLLWEYTGVETGQRFIYRTFLDDVEREDLSLAATQSWSLAVPDGSAFIDLTLVDGFAGHTVRVEFYLEGNLMAIGEFTRG